MSGKDDPVLIYRVTTDGTYSADMTSTIEQIRAQCAADPQAWEKMVRDHLKQDSMGAPNYTLTDIQENPDAIRCRGKFDPSQSKSRSF